MATRTAKVSFGFLDKTPTQKGMFGDNVIAGLTDNAGDFPTPDVPLTELNDVNNALKLKTQQAMNGDKVKIEERNAAEVVWNDKFRKEGEYVQRIANGNKVLIAKSGYEHTDTESEPVEVPGQAQVDAWANKGRGSGIHIEMEPLNGCRGLIFFVSTQPLTGKVAIKGDQIKMLAPEMVVDIKLTTKRKVDITDLTSGQLYYVSALGFNASGVGEMANPVEVIAP